MSIKRWGSHLLARWVVAQTKRWAAHPERTQARVLKQLLSKARETQFGRDHQFASIHTPSEFKAAVPLRDYEALRPWIDRMVAGEANVLWPGKPLYLAKTSGTTSGTKYIPLTRESMPYHISAARNALLHHVFHTGDASFVDGKMIFLQGSPELETKNGIQVGRLSGIVAHYIPSYLQSNRLPSWDTNCMEDWEAKVDAIVEETHNQPLSLISGIPPWVQMYFERLLAKTGKSTIAEVFPQFKVFVTGGVSFEPYRAVFDRLVGRKVAKIEVYPASEGFIAYQDQPDSEDLLLLLDGGMYYEFVPAGQFFEPNPPRLGIGEVQIGEHYALILNTNAGLWGYVIGDTIAFTSLNPPRIRVTGRIKHFISAFGEHVIGTEVEFALQQAVLEAGGEVKEFHVSPMVAPPTGLPYHEWLIEFSERPPDLTRFAKSLDDGLRAKNTYYNDLIAGGILQTAAIVVVPEGGFNAYLKSKGKLGGQNKLPRLANDRTLSDSVLEWTRSKQA
jgi:hypothetical protein